MKTVVIPDLHGHDKWRSIIAVERPHRVIFIGDYFDTKEHIPGLIQMNNFRDIIAYKKSGKSETILLIGNHEYHYMPAAMEAYSGYQFGAGAAIRMLLMDHIEHLQMAYQDGHMLFTHAGVTRTFLDRFGYFDIDTDKDISICQFVNDLFLFKPYSFRMVYDRNSYGCAFFVR